MALSIWQLKRQLAYLAGVALWEGGAPVTGLLFTGGSFVSDDLDGAYLLGSRAQDGPRPAAGTDNDVGVKPFCRVRCNSYEYDARSNGSRLESAIFELFATTGGGHGMPGQIDADGFDSHGENMHTGALRASSDSTIKSQGRDSDEILNRFIDSLDRRDFVSSTHGFQGRARMAGRMVAVNGRAVEKRSLIVEVYDALDVNYYAPGRAFEANQISPGVVQLNWSLPPTRFDTKGGILKRGNAGDPAPTSPTSGGTSITISGGVLGTVAGVVGLTPGTYNFSYWMSYAETPQAVLAGSPLQYSERVTAQAVVT